MISSYFQWDKNHSTFSTELLAGITTFLTMSYIVFINPTILATTGMSQGAVFTATCLITAFGSILLAMLANYPIAIAPGMALNVYFAYVVVAEQHYNWQNALGMVFLSGILFVLLTLTRLRKRLLQAIPHSLQIAIAIGISLLIALLALNNSHIIVSNPQTLMQLGDISSIKILLFILGFLLIVTLDALAVVGNVLIAILTITALSLALGLSEWHGLIAWPSSIAPTFMKMQFDQIEHWHALGTIFTFFLIALFDASGTFIGLLNQPLFRKQPHYYDRVSKGLLADSIATTAGAMLGTSSTSPFIESSAGIQAGGRTGLTVLITASLFLCALFFYPLARAIPDFAVGPALLYVACCMMRSISELDTNDFSELVPAVLTFIMIPFTFSIADGIGFGIISYVLLKLFTGQYRTLNTANILLAMIFLVYFLIQ